MTEICQLKCQSVTKFDGGAQDIAMTLVPNQANKMIYQPLPSGGCLVSWMNPPFVFVPGQVYSLQISVVK